MYRGILELGIIFIALTEHFEDFRRRVGPVLGRRHFFLAVSRSYRDGAFQLVGAPEAESDECVKYSDHCHWQQEKQQRGQRERHG